MNQLKTLNKILILIVSTSLLIIVPANAEESIRYKSTQEQVIKKNKWTTLEFNGKTSIQGNGNRSIFCYQFGMNTNNKKKPKYIKIRLSRIVSNKKDTTATNTYFLSSKPTNKFVASQCWVILTKYPVVVQVKISGGSDKYISDIRQFKMWTPGGNYPADFSDFIPEDTAS